MGNKPSSMLQDDEITLINEETGFTPAQIERLYSRFTTLDKSGNGSLSRQDCLAIPELAINPLCDRIVHMFFIDCDEDHDRINFRQFMKVLATFRPSSKPTGSRNPSRQESIQNVLSSLTENGFRHSRHSSCDGLFNYHPVQQHTTNQHSIHYVASTTHLSSMHSHKNHNHNHHHHHHHYNHNHNLSGCKNTNSLDPDEPANSRKQKLYFMFKIYDVDDDNLLGMSDLTAILKMMVGTYVDDARIHRIVERTLREADKNCDGLIDFEELCEAFAGKDIDDFLEVKFPRNDRMG